jgi:hypothetical protein
MTPITREELLSAMSRAVGALPEEDVLSLTGAVVGELCRDLPEMDVRALGAAFPMLDLQRGGPRAPSGLGLIDRVAAREALSHGRAKEAVESVLRSLSELLDDETSARMRKHLPAGLDATFTPRAESALEPSAPAPRALHTTPRATLATGRPGSLHPLSEARPERAHTHSIARSTDPHGDTKISSARGLTQERLHETLAEGTPPRPKRTLGG